MRRHGGGSLDYIYPSGESDNYGNNEKWKPSAPNAFAA